MEMIVQVDGWNVWILQAWAYYLPQMAAGSSCWHFWTVLTYFLQRIGKEKRCIDYTHTTHPSRVFWVSGSGVPLSEIGFPEKVVSTGHWPSHVQISQVVEILMYSTTCPAPLIAASGAPAAVLPTCSPNHLDSPPRIPPQPTAQDV